MNLRNNRNRFGRRFNSSSGTSRNRKGYDTQKLKQLIQEHYTNYSNNLQLNSRSPRERLVLLSWSVFTGLLGFAIVCVLLMSVFIPSVRNTEKLMGSESTKIYDVNNTVLYTVNGEENRENVESENIPDVVKKATIAIEDDRFYKHNGIDIPAIIKAILSELGIGPRRGGSTITQQFIKNAVLSSERTYTRKLKEMILAVRLERRYTKDEILTMYLNRIPYGGTAYGVQKAAETFFKKNAKELTLPEAVILASLPNAPTYYSPFGNHVYTKLNRELTLEELKKRNIENIGDLDASEYSYGLIGQNHVFANGTEIYLPGRTDEVLKRMEDLNYISEEDKNSARQELQKIKFPEYRSSIKAPHFVFYIREMLEKKYGKEMVANGGLRVFTTLDYKLQLEAEKYVTEQATVNASRFNADNLAMVSIDPKNGHVKAMVGSADYFNPDIDGSVNMATSLRQPGSSFKPIVYAAAFLNNVGPGTVLFDVPTKLGEDTPKNYDGGFVGPISIRRALGQSRNIPAIKAYYIAGKQDNIITLAESMGITTFDRRVDYGWPLSLGTGEVKMIEMAEAFGVFANGGYRVAVNPILKIEDKDGNILEDYTETSSIKKLQVVDPQVAYLINNVLSDRTVNLGSALNLPDGRVAAIKTGTSTKKTDNIVLPTNLWAVGYTPDLVTAVWAGNSDGTATNLSADGYNASVPVWNKFMTFALSNKPKVDFLKPNGIKSVAISKLSGKLPGANTPDDMITTDLFASFNEPTEIDDSFSRVVVDTRNNKLPNEFCPQEYVKEVTYWNPRAEIPDFMNWQGEIIAWFNSLDEEKLKALNLGENLKIGKPLDEVSELCNSDFADNELTITVKNPVYGDKVKSGLLDVETEAFAEAGISKVEFYINDELEYTTEFSPFHGKVKIPSLPNGSSVRLSAKVIDSNGYSKTDIVELAVDNKVTQ